MQVMLRNFTLTTMIQQGKSTYGPVFPFSRKMKDPCDLKDLCHSVASNGKPYAYTFLDNSHCDL